MKKTELVLFSDEIKHYEDQLHRRDIVDTQTLMENAGLEIALFINKAFPEKDKHLTIWCGTGNNGGDGLVAGRLLHQAGYLDLKVFIIGTTEKLTPLSLINYQKALEAGVNCSFLSEENKDFVFKRTFKSEIIVDSLFGIGLRGQVKENYQDIIKIINKSPAKKISVDIPSGIDADTGVVLGVAVEADYTVTMGTLKPGLLFYPGRRHAGEIYIANICKVEPSSSEIKILLADSIFQSYLPKRMEDGHKGTYGRLLFIGGSFNYQGAPVMSSLGFFKVGGGYLYSLVPKGLVANLTNWVPEVVIPGKSAHNDYLTGKDFRTIQDLCHICEALIIGPGLGKKPDSFSLVKEVIDKCNLPLIIDGDALMVVKDLLENIRKRSSPTMITPHAGEMEFITGNIGFTKNKKNMIHILIDFARNNNIYLLFKGNPTIAFLPKGKVIFIPTGNEALATPGSGDVLTGMIGGFIAQKVDPDKAIQLSAYLHGIAGELLTKKYEKRGILARDIPFIIPEVIDKLRSGNLKILKNRFLKEVKNVKKSNSYFRKQ